MKWLTKKNLYLKKVIKDNSKYFIIKVITILFLNLTQIKSFDKYKILI